MFIEQYQVAEKSVSPCQNYLFKVLQEIITYSKLPVTTHTNCYIINNVMVYPKEMVSIQFYNKTHTIKIIMKSTYNVRKHSVVLSFNTDEEKALYYRILHHILTYLSDDKFKVSETGDNSLNISVLKTNVYYRISSSDLNRFTLTTLENSDSNNHYIRAQLSYVCSMCSGNNRMITVNLPI